MNIDLNDIGVFAVVVQERGFTAASRILGLPPSTVSRKVARLEDDLGFKLLNRTTRRVGLTEAGRIFYERTAGISQVVREAVAAVSSARHTPSGTLRITAPPDDSGVIWELLEGFMRQHPRVDLQIHHTLERVDLVEEGFDVALRGGSKPDSTLLTAQLLFDSRMLLVASPAYLALRGTPRRVEALAEHDGICMDGWAPNAIRRLDGDRGTVRVAMRNRIQANRQDTARRAAVSGLGIAPLIELSCRRELASGALVEVLRGALPPKASMWVISRLGRDRSAAATALVRHVMMAVTAWESSVTASAVADE
ncbi:MAG: DNA-binding transcriptional LysR family regulator [Myxococcota bacterium]|jgi:DNA-binding transcriptional LysR family regulator